MPERSDETKRTQVIVIGSGFGGSVTASRLIDAGYKVTLLERGPWRDTVPVRNANLKDRKPLPRAGGLFSVLRSLNLPFGPKKGVTFNKNGYLDLFVTPHVKAVCTSNVGGGSHIWGAIMERPPKGFWDGRSEGLSDNVMEQHYQAVSVELKAAYPSNGEQVPNSTDHAWKDKPFFVDLEEAEKLQMSVLYPDGDDDSSPRAVSDGVLQTPLDYNALNGIFGSPSGSKSTTDAIYLLPALKKGLDVRDQHLVEDITAERPGGYRVRSRDLVNRSSAEFHADIVIVAAGTMNTLRLLMASRANGGLRGMTALGKGFGVNGDCLAKWAVDDTPARNSCLGAPVHGRVKINGHEDAAYVIIASNEPPPVPGLLTSKARKIAGAKFEVVAMGQDSADGKVSYDGGRLMIDYEAVKDPLYQKVFKAFDSLEQQSGWSIEYDKKSVVACHTMGGARIAGTANEGIVNGLGEVYGHAGLYVADASVFPQPVGVPPSFSIAAWASHVAAGIVDTLANRLDPKDK